MARHGGIDHDGLITTERSNDSDSVDADAHQGTSLGANHLSSDIHKLSGNRINRINRMIYRINGSVSDPA